MNGKKSKALRRLALAKTVGKPAVHHVTVLKTEKVLVTGKVGTDGQPEVIKVPRYQVRLHPDCTRRLYQRAKRAYKEALRSV